MNGSNLEHFSIFIIPTTQPSTVADQIWQKNFSIICLSLPKSDGAWNFFFQSLYIFVLKFVDMDNLEMFSIDIVMVIVNVIVMFIAIVIINYHYET